MQDGPGELEVIAMVDVAHANLGNILNSQGKLTEALGHFRQVSNKNMIGPLSGMAYILATHPDPEIRDVKTAIQLAERASVISGYNNTMILNTLATTYYPAGEYEKAVTLASAEKDYAIANYIRAQLALHQQAMNSL